MKNIPLVFLCIIVQFYAKGQTAKNYLAFELQDSVKSASFLATIQPESLAKYVKWSTGIQTPLVSLFLFADSKQQGIEFAFPKEASLLTTGNMVMRGTPGTLRLSHTLNPQESYQLMLSTASDSAGNFAIYSAYVYLPASKKWKLMGSCQVANTYETIKEPAVWWQPGATKPLLSEAWAQRMNGSWKNLLEVDAKSPIINLSNHADSMTQVALDLATIKKAITEGKIDAVQEHKGIYYTMMKNGNGSTIHATDTVTIFYKGYLLSDGKVFDQTTDSPRRFPLNRLIAGWQIGVPLCTTGGKIKLLIPSNLAYGIRTRSPKIPPNSVLVFEIEVLDTTPIKTP